MLKQKSNFTIQLQPLWAIMIKNTFPVNFVECQFEEFDVEADRANIILGEKVICLAISRAYQSLSVHRLNHLHPRKTVFHCKSNASTDFRTVIILLSHWQHLKWTPF